MFIVCDVQLTFTEAAESNAGPFTVEAHVRSIDDEDVFKPGVGKVRTSLPICLLPAINSGEDWMKNTAGMHRARAVPTSAWIEKACPLRGDTILSRPTF